MQNTSNILDAIIFGLPTIKDHHCTTSAPYALLKHIARHEITSLFSSSDTEAKSFGPFGTLAFPYHKMGAIDSLDLFGLDELIIFSFYWINRNRYRRVLDIGGNIGLHSIVMSRCGYEVKVFEPDYIHFKKLIENLSLNKSTNVNPIQAAVSTKTGTAEFVRVLGNTTSSHLEGCKNPYGDLEKITVNIESFKDLIHSVDLIKMDVEGHEKDLILSTTAEDWSHLDAIIEVGSKENAKAIFDHLQKIHVNAFAQKKNWAKVSFLEDMPISHKDGSLFISTKNEMPWSA
ncbi:MAG: FkbM family methyltransferase [Simkania sp.]|nr:FkbM family methyltransferase [Simkania sp.]